MPLRHLLMTAPLLVCLACGTSRVPGAPPLSGNWAFYSSAAGSATPASAVPIIGGRLVTTPTSATANFYLAGDSCFAPGNLQFAGKIQLSGSFSFTSTSINGQVITLQGNFAPSGTAITSGSYSVAGGCAGGRSGSLVGQRMPILTGNWSGNASFTPPSGAGPGFQSMVYLQFDQSSAITDFWYPLSGSIQIPASPCGSAAGNLIENIPVDGLPILQSALVGNEWWAAVLMADGSQMRIVGRFPLPGSSAGLADFTIVGGHCDGYTATAVPLAAGS